MSIVNFFFWVMLLLLGTLAGVLVDSFARAEKIALAELDRLRHTAKRPRQSYPPDRCQRLHGSRSVGCPVATDEPRQFSAKVPADVRRLSANQRQPGTIWQNKACFYTIDVAAAADHQINSNLEAASSQPVIDYDFSLPHAAGYDLAQRQNEKAVLADCPSCA